MLQKSSQFILNSIQTVNKSQQSKNYAIKKKTYKTTIWTLPKKCTYAFRIKGKSVQKKIGC